jgi:hypothetical protein
LDTDQGPRLDPEPKSVSANTVSPCSLPHLPQSNPRSKLDSNSNHYFSTDLVNSIENNLHVQFL